jgi:tetratricopeptide (TPR) repeat protein
VGDAAGAATYFQQVFDRRLHAGSVAGASEVANELGRVYLELGHPDDAFRWYRTGYETVMADPDRTAALADLAAMRWAHAQARIAARRGDEAEARRQMAVVETLLGKGTNPSQQIQLPYLLGYVAFYLGDIEAAILQLEQADQEDPFILVLLAQAWERSGRPERARDAYRAALASSSHAVTNAIARPLARAALDGRP